MRTYKYASSGVQIGLKPSNRQCKEGKKMGYRIQKVPSLIQAIAEERNSFFWNNARENYLQI